MSFIPPKNAPHTATPAGPTAAGPTTRATPAPASTPAATAPKAATPAPNFLAPPSDQLRRPSAHSAQSAPMVQRTVSQQSGAAPLPAPPSMVRATSTTGVALASESRASHVEGFALVAGPRTPAARQAGLALVPLLQAAEGLKIVYLQQSGRPTLLAGHDATDARPGHQPAPHQVLLASVDYGLQQPVGANEAAWTAKELKQARTRASFLAQKTAQDPLAGGARLHLAPGASQATLTPSGHLGSRLPAPETVAKVADFYAAVLRQVGGGGQVTSCAPGALSGTYGHYAAAECMACLRALADAISERLAAA